MRQRFVASKCSGLVAIVGSPHITLNIVKRLANQIANKNVQITLNCWSLIYSTSLITKILNDERLLSCASSHIDRCRFLPYVYLSEEVCYKQRKSLVYSLLHLFQLGEDCFFCE